jgi:hypothetical protein
MVPCSFHGIDLSLVLYFDHIPQKVCFMEKCPCDEDIMKLPIFSRSKGKGHWGEISQKYLKTGQN